MIRIPAGADRSQETSEAGDRKVEAEIAEINSGKTDDELRSEARRNQHRRDERFQDNWIILKICLLWFSGAIVAVLTCIWLMHLIGLVEWLRPEQLSKIEGLATGGILTASLAEQIKKQLR